MKLCMIYYIYDQLYSESKTIMKKNMKKTSLDCNRYNTAENIQNKAAFT